MKKKKLLKENATLKKKCAVLELIIQYQSSKLTAIAEAKRKEKVKVALCD